MPTFIPDDAWDALLQELKGSFMAAAMSYQLDLHSKLAEVLACAGVMPESCRSDFSDPIPRIAAL